MGERQRTDDSVGEADMSNVRRKPGEFLPGQEVAGLLSVVSTQDSELRYLARRKGRFPVVAALPSADASRRGDALFVEGGSGVADTLYACLKAAGGSYSWKLIATG